MKKTQETEELLLHHYEAYPKLQIQDIFKFLHQSSFGCEHLVEDEEGVIKFIEEEASECKFYGQNLIEDLGGEYCRVNLNYIKKGMSAETLGKLFCLSAKTVENGTQLLEDKLLVLTRLVKTKKIPFSEIDLQNEIIKWKEAGYPACRHSEEFRQEYYPAYRVIKKEYALFLPLFYEIDRLLQKKTVTFAIEGGSGSGKTTLSSLLEQIYDCNVFHMDDFFLRPHQRTKERFSEPGGNVDRERFLEEVLIPLSKNEVIDYIRFDCATFTLLPARKITSKNLNIIEGSYSMHPEFVEMYDFGVFLDISTELQAERIRKRNSYEFAKRFFEEWIPMEKKYHDAMKVKERCKLKISINS